jgi:trigger factor
LFAIAQPEPGAKLRLRIYIEQKHVDRAYQTLFQDLMNRGNIAGFRKGKVPLWRIRREYGPKAIDGAVYGELMEQALRCVLTYGNAHPLAPVDFEDEEDARLAVENQPLTTDALVMQIQPEVRVPSFEGIELKTPEIEPTDDELENELKRLQDAAAQLVEVERKDVQKGDQIEIVMRTKVEGEEGEPEARDESLIVGEDRYDPAIDAQLLGHSVGETVEFTTEYPDRRGHGSLAGKTVHFVVDIKDLRERKVPALDDEFAKQAIEGCQSLDALREEVKQRLRREHETLAGQVLRGQAVRWLRTNVRLDLPEAFLKEVARETADPGPDDETADDALQAIRAAFACEAVLAEKGVEITDDEVRAAYMAFGAGRGLDPAILAGDRIDDRIGRMFREQLVTRKAADIMAQAATKKVVPLSELAEELEASDEPSDEPTEDSEDA